MDIKEVRNKHDDLIWLYTECIDAIETDFLGAVLERYEVLDTHGQPIESIGELYDSGVALLYDVRVQPDTGRVTSQLRMKPAGSHEATLAMALAGVTLSPRTQDDAQGLYPVERKALEIMRAFGGTEFMPRGKESAVFSVPLQDGTKAGIQLYSEGDVGMGHEGDYLKFSGVNWIGKVTADVIATIDNRLRCLGFIPASSGQGADSAAPQDDVTPEPSLDRGQVKCKVKSFAWKKTQTRLSLWRSFDHKCWGVFLNVKRGDEYRPTTALFTGDYDTCLAFYDNAVMTMEVWHAQRLAAQDT